ncbi:hypothetical protein BDN72DRAFT_961462 [Pluteus cervinus]|uniref:Uncharacterized protein n=1 Tax=Pluteus cervinus TaxID=181527 RepID=A0ACD3AM89_9AGAR|nr:hypothetical protein BDN72DRAFT_961462 [Pluteus cervinus]
MNVDGHAIAHVSQSTFYNTIHQYYYCRHDVQKGNGDNRLLETSQDDGQNNVAVEISRDFVVETSRGDGQNCLVVETPPQAHPQVDDMNARRPHGYQTIETERKIHMVTARVVTTRVATVTRVAEDRFTRELRQYMAMLGFEIEDYPAEEIAVQIIATTSRLSLNFNLDLQLSVFNWGFNREIVAVCKELVESEMKAPHLQEPTSSEVVVKYGGSARWIDIINPVRSSVPPTSTRISPSRIPIPTQRSQIPVLTQQFRIPSYGQVTLPQISSPSIQTEILKSALKPKLTLQAPSTPKPKLIQRPPSAPKLKLTPQVPSGPKPKLTPQISSTPKSKFTPPVHSKLKQPHIPHLPKTNRSPRFGFERPQPTSGLLDRDELLLKETSARRQEVMELTGIEQKKEVRLSECRNVLLKKQDELVKAQNDFLTAQDEFGKARDERLKRQNKLWKTHGALMVKLATKLGE